MFQLFQTNDINKGLMALQNTPGSILLDVRTPEEFAEGRIPGSTNLPLQRIADIGRVAPDPAAPLFLYCASGARSRQAAEILKDMGYSAVTNLGGIHQYKGKVERA